MTKISHVLDYIDNLNKLQKLELAQQKFSHDNMAKLEITK